VEVNLRDGWDESNLAVFAKVISIPKPISTCMEPSTFDVAKRRKRINVFKVGKLWVFKHFFSENKDLFRQLADHYNHETYRFEFKSVGERNQARLAMTLGIFGLDNAVAAIQLIKLELQGLHLVLQVLQLRVQAHSEGKIG
jgi:hypothetical protein